MALRPAVGFVMVINVAEQEAALGLVNDEPDVGTHPHGPEVLILRPVELMEAHAVTCCIHLQVKSGRLCCLLLVACQPSEAVGEGVRDEEIHSVIPQAFWN